MKLVVYVPASSMSLSDEPSHFLQLSSHGGGRFRLAEGAAGKTMWLLFPPQLDPPSEASLSANIFEWGTGILQVYSNSYLIIT